MQVNAQQLSQHTSTLANEALTLQRVKRSAQITRTVPARYSRAVGDCDVQHVNRATAAIRIARRCSG